MARPKAGVKSRPEPLRQPFFPVQYCKEGHPTSIKRVAPGDLTPLPLGREERELLYTQSLDIFTQMTNAGYPFQDALSAILLTGLHWGATVARKEEGNAI